MDRIRELLSTPLNHSGNAHGGLLVAVGAYVVYMAVQMVRDTLAGISNMSMPLTVVLAVIMGLAGLAVIAYGGWTLDRTWQKEKEKKYLPDAKEQAENDSGAEERGQKEN